MPTSRTRPGFRPAFGAGLIVILIVLAIVLILLFGNFGSGSYTGQVAQARKQGIEVRQDIVTMEMSRLISIYRQANGKLPASPADLEAPGAFRDPWGTDVTFTFREEAGATKVIYKSNGPDGEAGTEDDVTREDSLPY